MKINPKTGNTIVFVVAILGILGMARVCDWREKKMTEQTAIIQGELAVARAEVDLYKTKYLREILRNREILLSKTIPRCLSETK